MREGTVANSSSDEDRLLRGALGKTAECPSVEALAAMNAKARAHVEHCAYCQNELAMLVEFQDATPLPGESDDLAWIRAELERRSAATPATVPAKSTQNSPNRAQPQSMFLRASSRSVEISER